MSYLNNEAIFREIIMDHVKNPRNKKDVKDESYEKIYLKNPSCGDELMIYVDYNFKEDKLIDFTYDVSGCSICCSSTSMMSELVINKEKRELISIIDNFSQMVMNKEYDEELLGDAISLKGIANVQPRIKCATLSYKALSQFLNYDGGSANV